LSLFRISCFGFRIFDRKKWVFGHALTRRLSENRVWGINVKDNFSQAVNRILVIRNGALGDFILTLPVMRILKNAFPSAKVMAMGHSALLSLARNYVDGAIPNNISGLYTLYNSRCEIPEHIRHLLGSFDLVVSYSSDASGTFIQNLRRMGIPWVIDGAFSTAEKLAVPAMERLIAPLEKAGIPVASAPPRIIPSPLDRQFAQEFFQSLPNAVEGSPVIVAIHPGSGSPKKCWPAAKFVQLALWAKESLGATILLVLGPADRHSAESLTSFMKTCKPFLASRLPLPHLAALLEKSTVYVGNDSGVTHVAAAVGTPTLALFGPTDHRIWGPQNKRVKCLRGIYHCAPCTPQKMAQCRESSCMESLPVASVQRAMSSLIARLGCSFPNKSINGSIGRKRYHVQR